MRDMKPQGDQAGALNSNKYRIDTVNLNAAAVCGREIVDFVLRWIAMHIACRFPRGSCWPMFYSFVGKYTSPETLNALRWITMPFVL